ncbi:hypothetical protein, partial [Streptomyces tricolor]|uniref:hypothetical protein n=1 Tax=Streptomyces tricolor TaxID=68277 RepID=UPI002351DA24
MGLVPGGGRGLRGLRLERRLLTGHPGRPLAARRLRLLTRHRTGLLRDGLLRPGLTGLRGPLGGG